MLNVLLEGRCGFALDMFQKQWNFDGCLCLLVNHGFCYPGAGRYAGRVRHDHPSCPQHSRKLCHHKTCRQSLWCNCHGERGRAEWFAALCLGAPRLPRSPRPRFGRFSRHSKDRIMFRQRNFRWLFAALSWICPHCLSLSCPCFLRLTFAQHQRWDLPTFWPLAYQGLGSCWQHLAGCGRVPGCLGCREQSGHVLRPHRTTGKEGSEACSSTTARLAISDRAWFPSSKPGDLAVSETFFWLSRSVRLFETHHGHWRLTRWRAWWSAPVISMFSGFCRLPVESDSDTEWAGEGLEQTWGVAFAVSRGFVRNIEPNGIPGLS